jgi:hypothetical protein
LEQAVDSAELYEIGKQNNNKIVLDFETKGTYCNVVLPDGTIVAILNLTTFRLMKRCQEDLSLRFQASISLSTWYQQLQNPSTEGKSLYSKIDVLVFGYQYEANAVAARLAKNRFYLQDPDHVPSGYQYQNPQALDIPDVIPLANRLFASTAAIQNQSAHYTLPLAADFTEVDFDRLLDNFSCSTGLNELSAAAEIVSTLLRLVDYLQRELHAYSIVAIRRRGLISLCKESYTCFRPLKTCGS